MREWLDLWDYRRRVHDQYRAIRRSSDPRRAREQWRAQRDELFTTHPQSPLEPERRETYPGTPFFPYDPAWRLEAEVEVEVEESEPRAMSHSAGGTTRFRPIGRLSVATPAGDVGLTLFWLDSYGGGIFLPFRDTTGGTSTYPGGRYLLDTVKGADLGHRGSRIVLDFNFAYHPSCVYSSRWSCPLAPPENHLQVPVEAGERLPEGG